MTLPGYFTLTAPGGHIIAKGDRATVEDRFARVIDEDGFPTGYSAYTMHSCWTADGRWGDLIDGKLMSRLVLGCDEDGWYDLDGSKVPQRANPARRLDHDLAVSA